MSAVATNLPARSKSDNVGVFPGNRNQDVLGVGTEPREARPGPAPFSLSLISHRDSLPDGYRLIRKDTRRGTRRGWAFVQPDGVESMGHSRKEAAILWAWRHFDGYKKFSAETRLTTASTRAASFLGHNRPPEGYVLITVEKFDPVKRKFGYGVGLQMIADWYDTKIEACQAARRHALQRRSA